MSLICACRCLNISKVLIQNEKVIAKRTFHAINTNLKTKQVKIVAPNLKQARNFSIRKFFKFFEKPTKQELYIRDNIPTGYELIYRSTLDRYLLACHIGVISISVFGSIFFVTSFNYGGKVELSTTDFQMRGFENEQIIYITCLIALVILTYNMVARTPLRIYSNFGKNKRYIMVFYGSIPYSTNQVKCRIGQVVHVPSKESSILPWKDCVYLLRSKSDEKKLIMMEENFKTPSDLYIMLGVQRNPDEDANK